MRNNNYLKNKRKFLFFIAFFFLFLIPFISSTAVLGTIEQQKMAFNSQKTINLGFYCSNCDVSSYRLQFINPDTQEQEVVFPSYSSTNSFFTISLTNNGIININSNSNSLYSQIVLYASDEPLSSQTSTTFELFILEELKPLQTQSLEPSIVLYGNNSISYSMNDIFLDYNGIYITYSDDTIPQSVYLIKDIGETAGCYEGGIITCLNPSTEGITFSITATDLNFNTTISIIAYNDYGNTYLSNLLYVTTYTKDAYSISPYRKAFSPAPIYLGYNDEGSRDVNDLFGNLTYINITYLNTSSGSNVSLTNLYGSNHSYTSDYNIYLDRGNRIFVSSYEEDVVFPIFVTACNSQGCNNDNNGFQVIIAGTPPIQLKSFVTPQLLSYGDFREIDMNEFFQDFDSDNITIEYCYYVTSDDTLPFNSNNYDMLFCERLQNDGVHETQTLATDYPSIKLENDIISLYSYNVEVPIETGGNYYGIRLFLRACNPAGCSVPIGAEETLNDYDFLGSPPSLATEFYTLASFDVKIINSFNPPIEEIKSPFWRTINNFVLDLFPISDNLSSSQKTFIPIIVLLLLLLFFIGIGYNTENMTTMLIIYGILSFFLFIFFTIKGYVKPSVLITILLIAILITIIKWRSSNG